MAAVVDSVAAFQQHVIELGAQSLWAKLEEAGWTTFASFNYSSGYIPGRPETEECLKAFGGTDKVELVYSDGHPSLIEATKKCGILHETSQPGADHIRAIIENSIGDELRGIRTILV